MNEELDELVLASMNDLQTPKSDDAFMSWLRDMIACLDMEDDLA